MSDLATLFPSVTFHNHEQGTPEWLNARKGVLTASNFGPWLAEEPQCRLTIPDLKAELKGYGIPFRSDATKGDLIALHPSPPMSHTKQRQDAMANAVRRTMALMTDHLRPREIEVDPNGPPPANLGLFAIWNGNRLEAESRQAFIDDTGLDVLKVGLAVHECGFYGFSADGIIDGVREGFESKSPLPETLYEYWDTLCDSWGEPAHLPADYEAQVHGSMAASGADAWWFQVYLPNEPIFRLRVERNELTERYRLGLEEFRGELVAAMQRHAERLSQQGRRAA